MPNRVMTNNLEMPVVPISYEALNVEVAGVKRDVAEVKRDVHGLEDKFDRFATNLSSEVRTSIASLGTAFNERTRTPWSTFFGAIAIAGSLLSAFWYQSLDPIKTDIRVVKEQQVPRDEINYRSQTTANSLAIRDKRIDNLDELISLILKERYTAERDKASKLDQRIWQLEQQRTRENR